MTKHQESSSGKNNLKVLYCSQPPGGTVYPHQRIFTEILSLSKGRADLDSVKEKKQVGQINMNDSPLFCFSCLLSIPHTSCCLFKILLFFSLSSPSAPPLLSSGPAPLKSLHCFPLSSSSLSCSWSPPLSDFDSYEVECRRHDDGELTSALRLAEGVTAVTLDHLEAYRKYSVTVRVSSAGQTSPPATHTTITMIDRELHAYTHARAHTHKGAVPQVL